LIFFPLLLISQQKGKSVISTGGTQLENSGISVNYTIGESFIGKQTNSISVNQGFQFSSTSGPNITSTNLNDNDNSSLSVTFNEEVFTSLSSTGTGSGTLIPADFSLSVSGGTAQLSSSTPSYVELKTGNLIANYPLTNDTSSATFYKDITGNHSNLTDSSTNSTTNFINGELGVYSDGLYHHSSAGTGPLNTPSINVDRTKSFAIELEFRMENNVNRPVIIAGTSYRWLGIDVNSSGNPGILYNNAITSYDTSTQLEVNRWYKGKIEYDFGVIKLYIDNNLVKTVGSTSNTVTFTAEGQGATFDEVLTNTNYSNSEVFKGYWKNLKVYNSLKNTNYEIGFELSNLANGQETLTVGVNTNSIFDSGGNAASSIQNSNTTNLWNSDTPLILEPTIPEYKFLGSYNGNLYFISENTADWDTANASATAAISAIEAFGGLAVIGDQNENNAIGSMLASNSFNDAWVGVSQSSDTATWTNIDGDNQTYLPWASGQPGGTNHNAVLFSSSDNTWMDIEKSHPIFNHILEITAFAITENSTSTFTIYENSTQSTNSLKERRIEVFDNKPITYSISGTDAQYFSLSGTSISNNSGTLDIVLSPRDFESPQDSNQDNVYELNLTLKYSNNASETIFLKTRVKDFADESGPNIISTTLNNPDNSSIQVKFNETIAGNAPSGNSSLTLSNYSLSISGGTATLSSTLPEYVTALSTDTLVLGIPLVGTANGSEIISVGLATDTLYDSLGYAASSSQTSNTVYLNRNLLLHYDLNNPSSYNFQNSTSAVNDLSGNSYAGTISGSKISYDSNEKALYFPSDATVNDGLFISGLNYISGPSDQLNELTIISRIKIPNHSADEENVILSFDRSEVFRFTIGSTQNESGLSASAGKPSFHFTTSAGSVDSDASASFSGDLRDNQWHDVAVTFKANQAGGLKYYIDGVLVHTDSNTFNPISNQNTNYTPRFGWIGTSSEATSAGGVTGPSGRSFYGHIGVVKYYNRVVSASELILPDTFAPTIISLTDNDLDNLVSGSSTVSITATYSEPMASAPTVIFSGIGNASMTASSTNTSSSATATIWYYNWDVPDSYNGDTTVTVSGSDISGNAYAGTDSITFTVDNSAPSITAISSVTTDNSSVTISFNETVYGGSSSSTATLAASDLELSLSGGTATLSSETPSSLTASGSYYIIGIPLNSTLTAYGNEVLTVKPASNAIFDIFGNSAAESVQQITLNDKSGPVISAITLLNTSTIQITFNEQVFTTSNASGTLQVSNFELALTGTGSASLLSSTPSSISNSGVVYTLGFSVSEAEGSSQSLVVSSTGTLYDSIGNDSFASTSTLLLPDADADGVLDRDDLCPNSAPGAEVGQDGCAYAQNDDDGDGVYNNLDLCMETPAGEIVDENGCSLAENTLYFDNDKDGVLNEDDICPETLPGEKVDEFGCSERDYDEDLDGVLNDEDECPKTPLGDEVDEKGCSTLPPVFDLPLLLLSEDVEIETLILALDIIDPQGLDFTVSIEGKDKDLVELRNGNTLFLVNPLDYENKTRHFIDITASNGLKQTTKTLYIQVIDIPNTYSITSFSVSVFDVPRSAENKETSKVDHSRYYNPNVKNKGGVGKWKIKKEVSGGADAALFTIRQRGTQSKGPGDTDSTGSTEAEDYLDFISPPDFENPLDHNRDNIYEVEVTNTNQSDGDPNVPVVVTQTQISVPEGNATAIQIQTVSVSELEDSDGDGVNDVLDNSPFTSNPNQLDSDGDGVGDVSDDQDHDGVWNPSDKCPETILGKVVDINGCELFYLPTENITINKKEKCIGTNEISAAIRNTSYTYNLKITGAINSTQVINDNIWSIKGLSAGVYSLCFTVEGVSATEYERCYEVTINEPQPLSVTSKSINSKDKVAYELSGGDVYNVTHNGVTIQTSEKNITLNMAKGFNQVTITTGIECQGIFEQSYFNSHQIIVTPNPFIQDLTILVDGEDRDIVVEIFASDGRLIHISNHILSQSNRIISLHLNQVNQGSYIVKVTGSRTVKTSEIIIKK